MEKSAELVFVPLPAMGHLVPMVELAKLMLERDDRLSATFLVDNSPVHSDVTQLARSLISTSSYSSRRIRFVDFPGQEPDSRVPRAMLLFSLVESQKPHVREAVSRLVADRSPESPRLAGFVLDMFCASMKDVADEFGVPSYTFFTSSAAFLGMQLHLQVLHDELGVDPAAIRGLEAAELAVPCLVNQIPAKVMPSSPPYDEEVDSAFMDCVRKYRRSRGIIVNTFVELESYALHSLSNDAHLPPLYPVGPILNLKADGHDVGPEEGKNRRGEIIGWLDDQPPSSVVFLCFGSMGAFGTDQVAEIASALEHGGQRFLWSLRRPRAESAGGVEFPGNYADLEEVLPSGFLDRTAEVGKVIGWAPQAAVLAHPAVGAFVSHCGWNSLLESLWFGVPIAAWPIFGEQQFNAFQLVVESGLAAEIKMDYRRDSEKVVSAEEIERGIRCALHQDSEIRKKVRGMSESSRQAVIDGGSSFSSLGRLVQDVVDMQCREAKK